MTLPSSTDDPQIAFLEDIRRLSDKAMAAGVDYGVAAYILLETSREAAMKGGPVPLYQHTYRMESGGQELRAEFEERFPDLDTDALIEGRIARK